MVEGCQAFSQWFSPSTNPPLTVLKVRLMETTGTDHFRISWSKTLIGKILPNLKWSPQMQKVHGRIKVFIIVYSLGKLLSYDPLSLSYPVPLESFQFILSQQDPACNKQKNLWVSWEEFCYNTLHCTVPEREDVYFFFSWLYGCTL